MQRRINHVVVLVVFQPHVSKTRSHLPSASACHFTRSAAWAHQMKNDICIGLCGGEIGYCVCLLLVSDPVFFFFNFDLLKVFWACSLHFSLSLSLSLSLSPLSLSVSVSLSLSLPAQKRLTSYSWFYSHSHLGAAACRLYSAYPLERLFFKELEFLIYVKFVSFRVFFCHSKQLINEESVCSFSAFVFAKYSCCCMWNLLPVWHMTIQYLLWSKFWGLMSCSLKFRAKSFSSSSRLNP